MWAKNGISKLILKYFFLNNPYENELVTEVTPKYGVSSAKIQF
jgi:hypothetical protein